MSEVVLITGGAGFLAQHLIKELQETQADRIAEIRVADKRLFRKFIEYPDRIPIVEYVVDCVEERDLEPAVRGATVVFNLCARLFTLDMYQDRERSFEDNVVSVKTLVSLMTKYNVEYLVHVSDGMAIIGYEDCQAPSELSTLTPPDKENWLYGPYGETKFKGELVARRANGVALSNDHVLKSIVIRPSWLYGEGENHLVPHALKLCQQYGSLLQIGDGTSVLQFTYAGNAAYMLVESWKCLLQKTDVFGGEVFFCNEYIPPYNYYKYIKPFVENAGYKLSTCKLNYELTLLVSLILQFLFRFLYMFYIKWSHNLPDVAMVRTAGAWYFHFCTTKARLLMDYKPKYNPDESMQKTIEWWKVHWKEMI